MIIWKKEEKRSSFDTNRDVLRLLIMSPCHRWMKVWKVFGSRSDLSVATVPPIGGAQHSFKTWVGGWRGRIRQTSALFERTTQALGEEEKKIIRLNKAEKRDRLVGGRWVAAFSRLQHVAGFKNKRCGRWKKGKKRRGIKRWMEFKDARQMDSGDARRAPSTRN